MALQPEIISLAFTESIVEVEGTRYPIEPVEAFTIRVLMKNKPEFLTTADIAGTTTEFQRREVTRSIRSLVPKVNAYHDVIDTHRQNGTNAHMFSIFSHVVEGSFSILSANHTGEYKVSDPDWTDDAACRLKDAHLFNTSENGNSRRLKAARQLFCDACIVTDDCLADAIITKNNFGIRGGLLPDERRPLVEAHRRFVKQQVLDTEK